MNQKVLTMICLKNILILKHVLFSQKIKTKMYETKNKNENNDSIKLTKIRWSNLKDKVEIMSEDEKKWNNQIKY